MATRNSTATARKIDAHLAVGHLGRAGATIHALHGLIERWIDDGFDEEIAAAVAYGVAAMARDAARCLDDAQEALGDFRCGWYQEIGD